jgi:hypothetical protein
MARKDAPGPESRQPDERPLPRGLVGRTRDRPRAAPTDEVADEDVAAGSRRVGADEIRDVIPSRTGGCDDGQLDIAGRDPLAVGDFFDVV